MPKQLKYLKEIEECRRQAEEVMHFFKLEKDGFADAYAKKQYEEMNELAKNIIKYIKAFARVFYSKKKSSMDQTKSPDFRKDKKLIEVTQAVARTVSYLKKDMEEVNLKHFMDHADQAQKKMYRTFSRLDRIENKGIETEAAPKPQISQSHLISENMDSWKQYVKDSVKPKEDIELDPLDEVNMLIERLERKKEEMIKK